MLYLTLGYTRDKIYKGELKLADTYKTIRCPACGTIMTKVFIPSAGVSVDICADGCGGIFFDNKELNHFKHAGDNSMEEINRLLSGKEYKKVDEQAIRICPACSTNMVKNNIANTNIQVDNCYQCGGIFLDYGELEIIRNSLKKYTNRNYTEPQTLSQQFQPTQKEFTIEEYYKEAQKSKIKEEADYRFLNMILDILGTNIGYRRHRFWL